jgi:hypothetical protein
MTRGADERRKMMALHHVVGLLRQDEAGGKDKRKEPSSATSKVHEKASLIFWPRARSCAAWQAHSLMSLNAPIDMVGPKNGAGRYGDGVSVRYQFQDGQKAICVVTRGLNWCPGWSRCRCGPTAPSTNSPPRPLRETGRGFP